MRRRILFFTLLLILFFAYSFQSYEGNSLKAASLTSPKIDSITPSIININEPTKVVIKGQNFASDTIVIFGGVVVKDAQIVSPTTIAFTLPTQTLPGLKTLSLLTTNGLAQTQLRLQTTNVNQLIAGQITTIAGGATFTGDGGLALEAGIGCIGRLTQDKVGNLFFADNCLGLVRQVDSQTGIITTVAGGGESTKDGILANTASLYPAGIIFDKQGNLLIGDYISQSIRKLNLTTGIITTIVTNKQLQPFIDSDSTTYSSFAFRFDHKDNLLFTFNNRVLALNNATGQISSLAGTNTGGFAGDGGAAIQSQLNQPSDIDLDKDNNIYIADTLNNRIRQVNNAGIITTFLGNGSCPSDNNTTTANLCSPYALSLNRNNLIIGAALGLENFNTKTQKLSLIKGKNSEDKIVKASISALSNIARDSDNNILFGNNQEQIIKLDRTAKKFAPLVSRKISTGNNIGPATDASFSPLIHAAVDNKGNIYISDFQNSMVRKIETTTNLISTIAKDVPQIANIKTDTQGNLYAIEQGTIVMIDPLTGKLTKIAGSGNTDISGDGGNALKAGLGEMIDFVLDKNQNIYILTVDRLRRIDGQTNIISTISSFDEILKTTGSLVIDSQNNLYFIDFIKQMVLRYNPQARKVAPYAGLGGNGQEKFSGVGGLALNASLGRIDAIAIDDQDDLIIAAQQDTNIKPRFWRVNKNSKIIDTLLDGDKVGYAGDGGEAKKANFSASELISTPKGDLLFINYTAPSTVGLRIIKR